MLTQRQVRKYFGYRVVDEQIKRNIDKIRERYGQKFEGCLEASRRGYRWKIRWSEKKMYIKKQGQRWVRFPIEWVYGGIEDYLEEQIQEVRQEYT